MKNKPFWIKEALKHLGLKEDTSKSKHNPVILQMLDRMGSFSDEAKAWWKDDETPWCGLFVGYCLGVHRRYVIKNWFRASAWESPEQTKLDNPAYGCIVTFTRKGGGHVGFVVGVDDNDNLMVLGGNQGNEVSIKPFSKQRVTGYFWPSYWIDGKPVKSVPLESRYDLPVLKANGELSSDES